MSDVKEEVSASGRALSFREIAESKLVPWKMTSDATMEELIQSFFLGDFEDDCVSYIFRDDYTPANERPSEKEPLPYDCEGHYWMGDAGVLIKTGKDLRHYPTADRRTVPVDRREVAEFFNGSEWMLFPWDGTDDGLKGIATVPLVEWPEDTQILHFAHWKMPLLKFEDWRRAHEWRIGMPTIDTKPVVFSRESAIELCIQWIKSGNSGRERFRPVFKSAFKACTPRLGNKEADAVFIAANQRLGRKRGRSKRR